MTHARYFSRETIVERLEATELEDAMRELLDVLLKAKALTPAAGKKVKALLAEKVEQGATGAIGHGVAIPHVKVPQIKQTVAALGRAPGGIDFRAGDGAPVQLCFLVVGPEDAPAEHLAFLRWIAGLARDKDFLRFALRCGGANELLDLLKEMSG